jgi:hypothetical protein
MSTNPADPGSPTLKPIISEDQLDDFLQQIAVKYPSPLDPRRRILEALTINWGSLMVGGITPQQKDEALADFTKLVTHGTMRTEAEMETETEHIWGPAAQYHGFTDRVRVKPDYYPDDDPRNLLNGKRGSIVGIRHGDIIVQFDHPTVTGVQSHRDRPPAFEVDITHLMKSKDKVKPT